MNSSSYFFRVEHDLLRSEAFKTLGGSAIKVYLVIGLYSDFGTDWAYPSIRTIARQAGLSRQTVLNAIEQLMRIGTPRHQQSQRAIDRIPNHSPGTSAPTSPQLLRLRQAAEKPANTGLIFLEDAPASGLKSLDDTLRVFQNQDRSRPKSPASEAQEIGPKENEHRKRKQHQSRFREHHFGLPRTAGFKLLLICKNC